jgi:hypothetical protein
VVICHLPRSVWQRRPERPQTLPAAYWAARTKSRSPSRVSLPSPSACPDFADPSRTMRRGEHDSSGHRPRASLVPHNITPRQRCAGRTVPSRTNHESRTGQPRASHAVHRRLGHRLIASPSPRRATLHADAPQLPAIRDLGPTLARLDRGRRCPYAVGRHRGRRSRRIPSRAATDRPRSVNTNARPGARKNLDRHPR